MLLNVYKKKWTDGFLLDRFDTQAAANESTVKARATRITRRRRVRGRSRRGRPRQGLRDLAEKYEKAVVEEDTLSAEKLAIANVGRQDAKKHLEDNVTQLMGANIVQTLGMMLDTVVF